MRFLFTIGLCCALPCPLLAQTASDDGPLDPIPTLKLDRKDPVDFTKEIMPILTDKCETCHSSSNKKGKYDLSTYEGLMKGGKRGAAIVPGKPDESLFFKLVSRKQRPAMPPRGKGDPLTAQELALVQLWITQGAKNSSSTVQAEKAAPKLGKLPLQVQPVMAVALSKDKSLVAAGRGGQIHLYETAKGGYLRAFVQPDLKDDKGVSLGQAHLDVVQAIQFSPDSKLLASSGFQEVLLWDPKTGGVVRKLTGFADRVVGLDFSPDGKWLATGGGTPTGDGEVKIFDVATGNLVAELKTPHSDTVFAVRFSPDGKRLATGGADKFVKLFEVPSGKLLRTFEGHAGHVLDVSWRHDGKILASASADQTVRTWNVEAGELAVTIVSHGRQITRAVVIGKEHHIATACGDALVRFCNMDNAQHYRAFGGNSDFLYALDVSGDGTLVAAGGQEGFVRLYNGTNAQVLHTLAPPAPTAPKPPPAPPTPAKK
jgi:WD40 repeat protein